MLEALNSGGEPELADSLKFANISLLFFLVHSFVVIYSIFVMFFPFRSAWVEVVLNNKGKDSYKPHVYGDKIIISRKFSAEGGSSYSIKSDKGKFSFI